MTPAQKTNAALTDVCRLLLEDYELTPQEIANLAKDIPGECEAMRDIAALSASDLWGQYAAMLVDQYRRRTLTLSKESSHE